MTSLEYQTYTVEFNRDGTPSRGHVVGRLKASGHRFLANHGDAETLRQLASHVTEPIGRSGWVETEVETEGESGKKGRNLFTFGRRGRL